MKRRISVAVTNDLLTDQRVHKVCLFLHDRGNSVKLIGRRKKSSGELDVRPYATRRMKLLFEKGPLFYAAFNLRLFFQLLFSPSDIIVANDLDTLLACRWAARIKRNQLVYDSHEYFTEVPELVGRPRVQRIWQRIESSIFPKLKHIITVNDSIADLFFQRYGKRPAVVRNIPSGKELPEKKTRQELNLPEDKFILIIQGAGINVDRGNEEMVESMKFLPECLLLIIGNGDVVDALKKNVQENHLQDRVLFFPRMPYAGMMQYTRNADLGITMDKDTNINYRFSLPNKVFDFIRAGIPVFASDLTEVKKIISGFEVGIISENHQPENIAKQIRDLMNNQTLYLKLKSNTRFAAQELTWENECGELDKIYGGLGA